MISASKALRTLGIAALVLGANSAQAALTITSFSASGEVFPLYPYSASPHFADTSSALTYNSATKSYNYSRTLTAAGTHYDFGGTMYGNAEVDATLSLGPSVMRGVVSAAVSIDQPGSVTRAAQANSRVNISALIHDRIVFTGISPGSIAQVLITNYVSNRLDWSEISSGVNSNNHLGGEFTYSSNALLYEDSSKIFGRSPAKFNAGEFKVCDTSYICHGNNLFSTGSLSRSFVLNVDYNDVLFIENLLSLGSDVSTQYCCFNSGPSYSSVWREVDFGHSGYTFLEVLTPGVDYIADSGARYLTALPSAVPEPASWALMIVGFGMIGAVLRQRDRLALIA